MNKNIEKFLDYMQLAILIIPFIIIFTFSKKEQTGKWWRVEPEQ